MTTTIRGTDNSAAAPALTGNDSDTGVYFPAANKLGLVTGGTERVIVDDSGNVGIGQNPSASQWTSTRYLGLGRLGNGIYGATGDDEINVGANVINTGSGTYIYGDNDTASLYRQVAAQHVWYRAISGTAGAAITLNESMRITSDGYLRMASGSGGIQFGGDTAAANALDDYEEGTFTPAIIGTTTAGTGTYVVQGGTYTKIGNVVYVQISLVWSAHTGTGALQLSGLPFTSGSAAAKHYGFLSGYVSNLTLSASNYFLGAQVVSSSTLATFYENDVGGGTSTTVAMDSAATLEINGSYLV